MSGAALMPTVLCIAGSPRRGGNSDRLLDAFSEGVKLGGCEAVRLVAATAGASPCRGCNGCSKAGQCVVRDGMDAVYEAIDSADALVIATPVFFATVPAVLKTLYDRFQPYWARKYVLGEPAPETRRPAALIVVGGGGDPYGMGCAVTPTRSILGPAGFELTDILEFEGFDRPGEVARHPADLERVRLAGVAMAERVLAHPR